MQMADRTMAHPLSQFSADPAGHTIASLRARTPISVLKAFQAWFLNDVLLSAQFQSRFAVEGSDDDI